MNGARNRIRVYSPFDPSPLNEGAFHVISNQVTALKELGFEVDLIHWKTQRKEPPLTRLNRVLRTLTTSVSSPEAFYYPDEADPALSGLPQADFGIYHFSFAYNWLKHRRNRPENKTFVHLHNIESHLFQLRSQVELKNSPWNSLIHFQNAKKLSSHEKQLPHLADELWFLSEIDLKDFRRSTESAENFRVIPPNMNYDLKGQRNQNFLKTQAKSQTLVLKAGIIGKFDFEPNRASLAWVIEELAPILEKRKFAGKIQVAGPGIPQTLRDQSARFPFIEVLGFIPDLEDFWANLSWMLVPQKGGSGVRIKLLEALASGVPVLANQEAILPLSRTLRNSPLLKSLESPLDWAEVLLQEKPFETRRQKHSPNLEAGLNGQEIYRFLVADSDSG